MKFTPLRSLLLSSCFFMPLATYAQTVNNSQYKHGYSHPVGQQMAFKPMTEKVLKNRLDFQIAISKRQMALDKKQADVYAANFAQFQKQQANALKQMLLRAEKQRQLTLSKMETQQQYILNQFSKQHIAQNKK